MSRTTNKLGKPLYAFYLRCDIAVKPTLGMLRQWEKLDHYAMQDYKKPYDSLTSAQKTLVHVNINTGIYREQEKKEKASRGAVSNTTN